MKTFVLSLMAFCCFSSIQASLPEQIAEAEVNTWKSYYAKDKIGLIRNLLKMLSLQFSIQSQKDIDLIAYKFSMAIFEFGDLPHETSQHEYDHKILPSLVDGYLTLKKATGATWDPQQVAQSDLAWWIARRHPDTNNVDNIGHLIAHYYTAIYGQGSSQINRAAFLRAAAARYRDLCSKWNQVSDVDWHIIQNLLAESYEALKGQGP